MKKRAGLVIAVSMVALTPDAGTAAQTSKEAGASANWTPQRTPWGDPDLRGTWPLDSVGRTPMQRPENLGNKAELTDAEYQQALATAAKSAEGYAREQKDKIGRASCRERV